MGKLITRLQKLEHQKSGAKSIEFIILTFDEGIVTMDHSGDKHPELIGKTETEIEALFTARDDVQVIGVFYASQTTDAVN